MTADRLTGPEIMVFQQLLGAAFLPVRFTEFLRYRLDRHVHNYVGPADDYPTTLRKVIEEANALLWWRDLLQEARKAVPADAGLLAFGQRFGLSPQLRAPGGGDLTQDRQLELKIKDAGSSFDVVAWRTRLGEIEGRVCRIEFPENKARGTGFLVGPYAVLTNYHVVEQVQQGAVTPAQVVLRFDYKVHADGLTVSPGTVHRLALDWLINYSPYSPHDREVDPAADPTPEELDYALLRVDGAPGHEPVGGQTNDPNPTPRRWVEMPVENYDLVEQRSLYIVQHPDGKPMRVALDTEAVIGLNSNATRVRYTTTTDEGSSGSPCFGPDWQWVALHHSGDPKYWKGSRPEFNQGIPVPVIRELLTSRGAMQHLGSVDSDSRTSL